MQYGQLVIRPSTSHPKLIWKIYMEQGGSQQNFGPIVE